MQLSTRIWLTSELSNWNTFKSSRPFSGHQPFPTHYYHCLILFKPVSTLLRYWNNDFQWQTLYIYVDIYRESDVNILYTFFTLVWGHAWELTMWSLLSFLYSVHTYSLLLFFHCRSQAVSSSSSYPGRLVVVVGIVIMSRAVSCGMCAAGPRL